MFGLKTEELNRDMSVDALQDADIDACFLMQNEDEIPTIEGEFVEARSSSYDDTKNFSDLDLVSEACK